MLRQYGVTAMPPVASLVGITGDAVDELLRPGFASIRPSTIGGWRMTQQESKRPGEAGTSFGLVLSIVAAIFFALLMLGGILGATGSANARAKAGETFGGEVGLASSGQSSARS